MHWLYACITWLVLATSVLAQAKPLTFDVELQVLHQELNPNFCWFHPRVAAIPQSSSSDERILICTLQKHLKASDHYSGLYVMRSDDAGRHWTRPELPPALDWQVQAGETIAVCDATPGWHAPSRKLLVIGTKLRYGPSGKQLLDQPRSHQCAYATWDPVQDRWSPWKLLALPDEESQHFLVAPGCVQWLVKPDGTILLPMYYRGPEPGDYTSTVLHCNFDGSNLELIEKGTALTVPGGRGLVEPSLAMFQGSWFLTLRNDARGYVATSHDGLHFPTVQPWLFDDGAELGSYNTQQHWLVHDQALFLCYTRRLANNDHIPRHRAPLLIAQVNPQTLRVMRSTERSLIPERGVMLGNFGASAITPHESWVTDAEYLISDRPHAKGADASVFLSRVQWHIPNRLRAANAHPRLVLLGDSITKGVRSGVTSDQTFAAGLQRQLQTQGKAFEVINQGIGGERTDQALARLSRDILSLEPSVVVVMYGTNDSYVDPEKNDSRITVQQFETNLRKIVGELRRCSIQPVLMTEPCWGNGAKLNGAGEHPNMRLEKYMEATRAVARETATPLIDNFQIWSQASKSGIDVGAWTTDQCHPNPAGHQQLTQAIFPTIEQLLKN